MQFIYDLLSLIMETDFGAFLGLFITTCLIVIGIWLARRLIDMLT